MVRGDARPLVLCPCNTCSCCPSAGEAVPSDLQANAKQVQSSPNEFQWLAAMYSDPARVADYIASNCVTETIKQIRSLEYGWWTQPLDYDLLDEDFTMVQCVDNFGAWNDFDR